MKQLLLIILLFSTNGILSQVTQEWVQRYDGPAGSFDIARQMILNQDGSVLVFGNSVGVTTLADMTIIKYSASGVEEWVSRYDYENRSDNITSAGMDMQGNIYITGFVTNSSKVSNLVLLKFDPAGNFLWIKTFDSTAFTQSYGESLTIAQDGNIYIAGTARNLSSNNDYITLKYTPSGQRLWLRVFNGTENGEDNALSIVSDDSNNVFITGTSKGSEPSTDIVTLKYDPSVT